MDSLDFQEQAVWAVKAALEAAYDAGAYEARVARYEAEGMTRSDAQATVEAEDLTK